MPRTGTMDHDLIPFHHNEWATRVLLDACRALSHEQFHQNFEIGLGNLHDTFRHIIGAMARWSDRIGGRPLRPSPEKSPGKNSIDELQQMLDVAVRDLEATAVRVRREKRLDELMEFPMPDGSTIHFHRATALVHVTTHGMHYRAQAMNMLRHLGIQTGKDFDPIEWEIETGATK